MKRYTIGKHTEVECEDGDWYRREDVDAVIKDLKMLLIEVTKESVALKEAVDMELYRVNNPSAWESFSQEGSDAIERIVKAAGLK